MIYDSNHDTFLFTNPEMQKLRAAGLITLVTSPLKMLCVHELVIETCSRCWSVAQTLLQVEQRPARMVGQSLCPACGYSYPADEATCPQCAKKEPILELGISSDGRMPMPEVMLRFAEQLAERSTCARSQVGAVVTDQDLLQVLGIGYNGNASGLPNRCDSAVPGQCGCLHAEINALLKAPGTVPGKHLFASTAPCVACAKASINARIVCVHFRRVYRDPAGLDVLRRAGVAIRELRDGWWTGGPGSAPASAAPAAPKTHP